jgi:hypothetical protein
LRDLAWLGRVRDRDRIDREYAPIRNREAPVTEPHLA